MFLLRASPAGAAHNAEPASLLSRWPVVGAGLACDPFWALLAWEEG